MALFIPFTGRRTKINWMTIEKCDLEQIVNTKDIETLESFMIPLSQGGITEKEFSHPLLPIHLLKYVYLMQIMLNYLEYSKQYQEVTLDEVFKEIFTVEDEIQEVEKVLATSKFKINKLQIQKKKLNKEIQAQKSKQREVAYACLYCPDKAFLTAPLLDAHYQRHHLDKFHQPKQNQAEVLLTVQTIMLQQQLNQMINNQASQDYQMMIMQQTQASKEDVEVSDSSQSEDHEDVGMDDLRMKEIEIMMEQKNQELQNQIQAVQNYMHVHQPKQLLNKISQLEDRLNNIKYIEQPVQKPPSEKAISYNAGSLHSDRSELDDGDLYNVKDQQQEIQEDMQSDQEVVEQEPEIKWENQVEAEFMQEERDFHHLVKLVTTNTMQLSEKDIYDFKILGLEEEIRKKMLKELKVQLGDIPSKNQEDLESYLNRLQGIELPANDGKTPPKSTGTAVKQKNKGMFDQFKKEHDLGEINLKKGISQPQQLQAEISPILKIKAARSEKTIDQINNSRDDKPRSVQVIQYMEGEDIIEEQQTQKKENKVKFQSEIIFDNQQQNQMISRTKPQQYQSQQQQQEKNSEKSSPKLQHQQQQQQQQQQQPFPLLKSDSKRKSSFEESEDFETQQIQTIFQVKKNQPEKKSYSEQFKSESIDTKKGTLRRPKLNLGGDSEFESHREDDDF